MLVVSTIPITSQARCPLQDGPRGARGSEGVCVTLFSAICGLRPLRIREGYLLFVRRRWRYFCTSWYRSLDFHLRSAIHRLRVRFFCVRCFVAQRGRAVMRDVCV